MRALRRLVFGISDNEIRFERRGFRGGSEDTRRRFDAIGRAFVTGYHAALDVARPERLPQSLQYVERELCGFAYEGAAMGFALLDMVTPWNCNRWRAFLAGPGAPHAYMVHIGAGWALARVPGSADRFRSSDNPALEWLVFDGIGFHQAYFHWSRSIDERRRPERLAGYSLRAFDQGLGRGLWFVEGGEPTRIARSIARFESDRHTDLWSGVGLAAAYAGGVSSAPLKELHAAAGLHVPEVAQGAAFAAQARARADNPAAHTDLACQILCAMSALDAANLTERTLRGIAREDDVPAYETWRRRIQSEFASEAVASHG